MTALPISNDIREFVLWADPILTTGFWLDGAVPDCRAYGDACRLGRLLDVKWEHVKGMANRVWTGWVDHVRSTASYGTRDTVGEGLFEAHARCLLTVCFLVFLRRLERNGWMFHYGGGAGCRNRLYLRIPRQNWRDAVQYCLYERWIALDARKYGFGYVGRSAGDPAWRDRRSFLRSIDSQQVFAKVLRDFVYKFEGRAAEHDVVVVALEGECAEPRPDRGFSEAAARDEIQSLYRYICRVATNPETRERTLWVARSYFTRDLVRYIGNSCTVRIPGFQERLAWVRQHDSNRTWYEKDLRRVDPIFRRLAGQWWNQTSADGRHCAVFSEGSSDPAASEPRWLLAS